LAFIARSDGRSNSLSGSTRAEDGDDALAGGAAAASGSPPMVGAKSANSRRGPETRPDSNGTRGRVSYVIAAVSLLEPTVASSVTTLHTCPFLRMRPASLNAPVVGNVTPSGSPAAASEGPDTRKTPFMSASLKMSVTVPLKLAAALPDFTSSTTGTPGAPASSRSNGVMPEVRRFAVSVAGP
jgi:hypothetical protein